MRNWDSLRRARDNIRPHRPINLMPKVVNVLIDEIRELKKDVENLKKQKKNV
jgi:glycerol-3-phosphate responsive antiterminator